MQTDAAPPPTFLCCITHAVMQDPVMDPEGNTYEHSAILEWLTNHNRQSPITRNSLHAHQLVPNRALRDTIQSSQWGSATTTPSEPHNYSAPSITTTTCVYTVERANEPPTSVVTTTSSAEEVPSKHVVLLIDTSGSMGSEASSDNEEQNGLTLLCIVKHAALTVMAMLRPQDRVTIITFNSVTAVVGTAAVSMSDTAAVESLRRALANVTYTGMTNMWAGLQKALDVARETNARNANLHANIMLLTDGLPNPDPPRGTDSTFQRWCDQFPEEAKRITVSTFGFGYRLNSDMLRNVASFGNGAYAFIPDSTFTGTVFIHAAASILSTLQPRALDGVVTGGVLMQQPRSALCCDVQVHGCSDGITSVACTIPSATLHECPIIVKADTHRSISLEDPVEVRLPALKILLETEAERKISECIRSILESTLFDDNLVGRVKRTVSELRLLCNELTADPSAQGCAGVSDDILRMIEDMTGQVTKAVSRKDWWNRWGRFYLGSLLSAYDMQTCNNFKDPGLQNERFCGRFMQNLLDKGDEIYVTMPPPTPPVSQQQQYQPTRCGGVQPVAVYRQPVDMSRYHDRNDGGCFSGDSVVSLVDGSMCFVQNLNSSCVVEAQDAFGNSIPGGARVLCVIEARDLAVDITYINHGLRITPNHPIRHEENEQWIHPRQVSSSTSVADVVFNVVLDTGAAAFRVGNRVCVSLGHMILNDPVASHKYLGTDAVMQDLRKCRGWESGHIIMSGAWLSRGEDGHCERIMFNAEI